jgi:Domain of unknown function (DUF4157)
VRKLEGPEIKAYDVLEPDLAARVRVQKVPVLPRGASGMTIMRLVMLRSDEDRRGSRKLLAHELVHVRQYAELGYVRFSYRYLRDYFRGLVRHRNHRRAYLAIAAEVQARVEADEWAVRHGLAKLRPPS